MNKIPPISLATLTVRIQIESEGFVMKQGMALDKIDSFDTKRLTLRLMNEAEWELFV